MSRACAACGSPLASDASRCSNCDSPANRPELGTHQLLTGLDDLSATADVALAEDLGKFVDQALGQLGAGHNGFATAGAGHSDLEAFVRRVESSKEIASGTVAPPPRRNRFATPLLAFGTIVAAVGVFLASSDLAAGIVTLLAGIGIAAMGSVLYASRPTFE